MLPDTFLLSYQVDKVKYTHRIDRFNQHISLDGLDIELQLTGLVKNSAICRQKITLRANKKVVIEHLSLFIHYTYHAQDRLFCNGFQSWTETREFLPTEQLPSIAQLAKNIVGPFGDYHIIKEWSSNNDNLPVMPPLHGWSYGYIRPENSSNHIYFIGSLAEASGYTAIGFDTAQNRVIMTKDAAQRTLVAGETFLAFDLLLGIDNESNVFSHYQIAIGQASNENKQDNSSNDGNTFRNHIAKTQGNMPQPLCAGWTSWYQYYTAVSEDIVLRDMFALAQARAPVSWIQIDDGWQHAIGDWLIPNHKFGSGMRFLVDQITDNGFGAGLWLAPFICTAPSNLYRQHPDWLLRDDKGKPITAGYNPLWRSWLYVLDWQNPSVVQYLQEVFHTICHIWGFRLLKLDFLYAAALYPREHQTRGELMYEANLLLRRLAGDDIVLLGCGTPLAPAFGVFDYCRIGADVHTAWEMPLLKWLNSRERVSTVLTLHNTINRRQLNGVLFGNDPDVSILRSDRHQLKQSERYTLFLLNQLFGAVQFISDNIAEYDAETKHLYLSQFPLRPKQIERVKIYGSTYQIHFCIGQLRYLAFANLGETAFKVRLKSEQRMWYFDCKNHIFMAQDEICLQAHESICLLCTVASIPNQIAGSTGHLFAGSEVKTLHETVDGTFSVVLSDELRHDTTVFITTQNGQVKQI